MKKFFSSLFSGFGKGNTNQTESEVEMVDQKTILYSIPSIADSLPELEPLQGEPGPSDILLHEDDWLQREFFPRQQLPEIQHVLTEYNRFEEANRTESGWREIYVRKIQRTEILIEQNLVNAIENKLGLQARDAPVLFSSGTISGRVSNGFTIPLGGNIHLYGYVAGNNVPALGAYVGEHPDDLKLTEAFLKLNASDGLILVDWLAQFVLVSQSTSGQIETWSPPT